MDAGEAAGCRECHGGHYLPHFLRRGVLKRACQEILEKGTFSGLTEGAISFDELNSLATPKHL